MKISKLVKKLKAKAKDSAPNKGGASPTVTGPPRYVSRSANVFEKSPAKKGGSPHIPSPNPQPIPYSRIEHTQTKGSKTVVGEGVLLKRGGVQVKRKEPKPIPLPTYGGTPRVLIQGQPAVRMPPDDPPKKKP